MTSKQVSKTVAFFEIRDEAGDALIVQDWQAILGELAKEAVGDPTVLKHEFDGAIHYARVYPFQETDHLVLARTRDESPSRFVERTGEIIDAVTRANAPWVEVSVVHFIENTNVFGIILGSISAPRASVVADWFNEHGHFEDYITVVPHMSEVLVDRLRDGSSEASLVYLKVSGQQAIDSLDRGGLYSAAWNINRNLELGTEVDVEVTLRISGRAASASEATRRSLADLGRDLIGTDIDAGKVELVELDDEKTNREVVNLVKHKMSTKQVVTVVDEDGRQVRIPSAITAIYLAADELQIGPS